MVKAHFAHLEITLIGVEDDRFFLVILSHHFHGYSVDRRLEIGLLSIYHHSDIGLFSVSSDRVYASHHVLVDWETAKRNLAVSENLVLST